LRRLASDGIRPPAEGLEFAFGVGFVVARFVDGLTDDVVVPPTCSYTQEFIELQSTRGELPFRAGPVDVDYFTWNASVQGPKDSPFEGAWFEFKLLFPRRYPSEPPRVVPVTRMYHPNIAFSGGEGKLLGVDALDMFWSPAKTVVTVLGEIHRLMGGTAVVSRPLSISFILTPFVVPRTETRPASRPPDCRAVQSRQGRIRPHRTAIHRKICATRVYVKPQSAGRV
jgi:ubiquitin-protein ligase